MKNKLEWYKIGFLLEPSNLDLYGLKFLFLFCLPQ